MNSRRSDDLGYEPTNGYTEGLRGAPFLKSRKPTKREQFQKRKKETMLVAVRQGMKPLRVYRDTEPDEIKRMVHAKINALNRSQSTQEQGIPRNKRKVDKNANH